MENRKKIFIVDDDVANLRAGTAALSGKYDVYTLNSGQELLQLLKTVLPDLILLDIMMPGTDGHEVLKLLKADTQTEEIPVFFLTAKGDIGTVLEGISGGVNDYIVKPFDREQLLERIDARFSRRDA
ncbi:MAG: response regulator [Defluviitaleaceae bacterium]|nr:response regulator [Defluviitaleaceae bacterium]